jgi:hypothetical protein
MGLGESVTVGRAESRENPHPALPEQVTSNGALASIQEQIEFLKVEIEHFYKAEIHSEQRASWLLTIAFGGLVLVLNSFLSASEHNLNTSPRIMLAACAAFLFCAVVLALVALWPLRGWRGVLQSPFNRCGVGRPPVLRSGPAIDYWAKHYAAHRIRATKKAVRVVWTLLLLCLGIVTGGLAVLANTGIIL